MIPEIKLPKPRYKSNTSIEEAILKRRSVRDFISKELTLEEISQILWASQGITDKDWGHRSVPSAGALYPIEIYLVLAKGVYRYLPARHSLKTICEENVVESLWKASLSQDFIKDASMNIVIAAVFERTTRKYGERGARYVYVEAGHVSQNIYLQCAALNLGACAIGAFYDDEVQRALRMPENHRPIYIMSVGKKR